MNDFLTRLAQRSMGAAPLIAPRLPSLFAPAEESNSNVADSTAGADMAHRTTLVSPPVPSSTPAHNTHASIEPQTPLRQSQRSTGPEAALSPVPAARPESVAPRAESTLTTLVQTVHEHTQAAPQLGPVASRPTAAAEPLLTPRKQDDRAAPEPWKPLLPQRKAESAAAFPAVADTPVSTDTGTPPAPTVHITIGRVEVRANIATPPAAPRPRTVSQPALSLSDYLKRGAGAS